MYAIFVFYFPVHLKIIHLQNNVHFNYNKNYVYHLNGIKAKVIKKTAKMKITQTVY